MKTYKIERFAEFAVDGHFTVHVEGGEVVLKTDDPIIKSNDHPPAFEHDCDKCVYFGTYNNWSKKEKFDMYFCNQGTNPLSATVIARYGNEGHEYGSGLGFHEGVLKKTEDIARRLGLLEKFDEALEESKAIL